MFAIVEIQGKQYRVSEKDRIDVSYIEGKTETVVTFERVLLVSDGKKVTIGSPTVKGFAVKAKIISQEKGEKINVRRYKQKVRYRKSTGFRPRVTKLEILSIGK